LPDEVVRVRPVLALGFVGAIAQVSDFDTVEQRLAVIEGALRTADGTWPADPPPGLIVVDVAEYPSVPARIELYRAAVALSRGELDGTAAHAREALSRTPSDDGLTRAAAGALAGLASWTTGDLATAHAAYTESVDGLRKTGMIADVLGCSITLGDICRTQGKLRAAVRIYERALELANPEPDSEPLRGTADMHVALAEIALERDDLAGATEHLAQSERLGEHKGLPQNPYRQRVIAARLRQAEGDLNSGLALLDEADRVYDGDYSPNVRPVPATRARLRIRRGDLGDAGAWADEQGLSAGDDLSYLREYEHITLARLLLARNYERRDDAVLAAAHELLGRLLSAAEDGGRDGTVIELLVLQSLAQLSAGDLSIALSTLQRAVTLAQPDGYVRVFADEGAPMATLLKSLLKTTSDPAYVRRLLAATTRTGEPVAASAASAALVAPLSERELDVLRWLATDLDGPDIARQLSVSLNTVRTHTKNIYAKLGVTNRRAAVRQAHELDLLPRR
jgi:LuxR family maltose regulon positive regulatory protein